MLCGRWPTCRIRRTRLVATGLSNIMKGIGINQPSRSSSLHETVRRASRMLLLLFIDEMLKLERKLNETAGLCEQSVHAVVVDH
jgi:hypothetical protein